MEDIDTLNFYKSMAIESLNKKLKIIENERDQLSCHPMFECVRETGIDIDMVDSIMVIIKDIIGNFQNSNTFGI